MVLINSQLVELLLQNKGFNEKTEGIKYFSR
jgi:hypothetical protein